MVLACDLVVAAESATFSDGHAAFGLFPGAGASPARNAAGCCKLRPWEARFEIADRRVVTPAAVGDILSLRSHPFAAIIRRELQEAARWG